MDSLQAFSFLIYVVLIALTEVWMLRLVFADTSKAYFLAISPLRWLAVIILVSKHQLFGLGYLYMLLFIATFYWLILNLLVNPLVLKKPILYVGTDGKIGELFNNLFGRNVSLLTLIIKIVVLASTTYLYWNYIT